jgi:MFS family permease
MALSFPVLLFGGRLSEVLGILRVLLIAFAGFVIMSLGFAFVGKGVAVFGILMVIRGLAVALLDLGANAVTMDLERVSRRHLMSQLHAAFSGGTIAGAAMVSALFIADFGFRAAYLVVALCFVSVSCMPLGFSRSYPLQRQDHSARSEAIAFTGLKSPDIRLTAVLAALAFGGETLIAEWSAIYLRDERDLSGSVTALAIGAFGSAMLVGRLCNGPVIQRFGLRRSVAIQGSLGGAGGALIILGGPAVVALFGAFLAGLGFAGVAPTALSLAGKAMPHAAASAAGLTLFGGYTGLALAPVLGGVAASAVSTRLTLSGVAIAGVAVLLLSARLPKSSA